MKAGVLAVTLPLVLLPGMVLAQTKISGSGRCGKADVEHSIPAPDRPNHTFGLSQGKCVWTKPWEIDGIKGKEGVATISEEMTGDSARAREFYVDTMENGDKAFYRYEATTTLKEGKPQSSQGRWTLVGGTGKLKGAQGKGTCKVLTFEADGGITFECEGEYTLPAPKKP